MQRTHEHWGAELAPPDELQASAWAPQSMDLGGRCSPVPATPPAIALPPTAFQPAPEPPQLAGPPDAHMQPHPHLAAALAALLPLVRGGDYAGSGTGSAFSPVPPRSAFQPWMAAPSALDGTTTSQLQAPAASQPVALQSLQDGNESERLIEAEPLLPLLAAAAAAGGTADDEDQPQYSTPTAAAGAAGSAFAGPAKRHTAVLPTGGFSREAAEDGGLPFRPHITPSIKQAMKVVLPSGREVRGARTPASAKGSGAHAGSWQTWVHYNGRQAFVGRLSRHTAAVAADLVLAWQRNCLTAKVAQKASLRQFNLPEARYEEDEELMAQLRNISTAEQMKQFLLAILPQDYQHTAAPAVPRTRHQPAKQQRQRDRQSHTQPASTDATPPRHDSRRKQSAPKRSRAPSDAFTLEPPGVMEALLAAEAKRTRCDAA